MWSEHEDRTRPQLGTRSLRRAVERAEPPAFRGAAIPGALALSLAMAVTWTDQLPAAQTATLTAVADTALLESFPTNNLGGQPWLNAGTTQNYTRNRGLLKFDIAGRLPAHARIVSASLTLHVTRSPVDGDTPSTFDLHRMLRDWGEGNKSGVPPLLGAPGSAGECTWTHRSALTAKTWAEPGAAPRIDFAEAGSGDTFVYGENFSPYTFDSTSNLVADVQLWQRHPEQNFGWLLKTRSEAENFSARRFSTREDPFRIPTLSIEYDLPRLEPIAVSNARVHLSFVLEPGEACDVEFCDVLAQTGTGGWTVLSRIPAPATRTNVIVSGPLGGGQRYYRLRIE